MARNDFLYQKIYSDVLEKIENGVYPEGMKLATDIELGKAYGVSIITVKKALNMLRDEGFVKRVSGVGTFVNHKESKALQMQEITSAPVQPQEKKIGLVIEHVTSAFGLDLLYRLDQEAERNGYKLLVRFSYYDREKETEEIDFLLNQQIDGLLVMPCHGVYYNPTLLKLILEGFPMVIIDKKLEGISVPSVRTENLQAARLLLHNMWEEGCRCVGFISPKIEGTSSLQSRLKGFKEEAKTLGIQALPECILAFDQNIYDHLPNEENVQNVMEYLKEYRGEMDGIMSAEYSLVPALKEAIRRLGEEYNRLTVCSIDGLMGMQMTYAKQNEQAIAGKALEMLTAQIDKEEVEDEVMIPATIVKAAMK